MYTIIHFFINISHKKLFKMRDCLYNAFRNKNYVFIRPLISSCERYVSLIYLVFGIFSCLIRWQINSSLAEIRNSVNGQWGDAGNLSLEAIFVIRQCSYTTWHERVVIDFIKISFITHTMYESSWRKQPAAPIFIASGVCESAIVSLPVIWPRQECLLFIIMETNGTVHYALVALWEKTGCRIVADYPADQDPTYRAVTLSTVDGLKTVEDEKISVDRGK